MRQEDSSWLYYIGNKGCYVINLFLSFRYEAHKNYPDLADYDKRTPLHLAAVENKLEVVKYLIEEWKVDLTATDRFVKLFLETETNHKNQSVEKRLCGICQGSQ